MMAHRYVPITLCSGICWGSARRWLWQVVMPDLGARAQNKEVAAFGPNMMRLLLAVAQPSSGWIIALERRATLPPGLGTPATIGRRFTPAARAPLKLVKTREDRHTKRVFRTRTYGQVVVVKAHRSTQLHRISDAADQRRYGG
jgi:hypothetical protein